jgi:hypothetical protein
MPATMLLALENLGRFDIRKSVSASQLCRKASLVKDVPKSSWKLQPKKAMVDEVD